MTIFISGILNSGKTTTGKLLAQKLGAEFIDFDDIHPTIPDFTLAKDLSKVFDIGIERINALTSAGKSVVISYVITQSDYERLQRGLNEKAVFFTLAPPIEVVLSSELRPRELRDWDRQRIPEQYALGYDKPSFGTIIDNSNMTVEQVVALISKT